MNDAEYLRGMARQSREAIGHSKEGREHADRLERMATKLESEGNKSVPSDFVATVLFAIEDLRRDLKPGEYHSVADRLERALEHASEAPTQNSSEKEKA